MNYKKIQSITEYKKEIEAKGYTVCEVTQAYSFMSYLDAYNIEFEYEVTKEKDILIKTK